MSEETELRAKVYNWARTELIDRHRKEYYDLCNFYREHLGLPVERKTRPREDRPTPPPTVGKKS